jgi:hypothetical protein
MSRTTNAVAVSTIGIDTGKNTLHLIGLDEQGMIAAETVMPDGAVCPLLIRWRPPFCSAVNDVKGHKQTFRLE